MLQEEKILLEQEEIKKRLETLEEEVAHLTRVTQSGVADELAKLAKLKADGILTEEEFNAQKAKLLNL